MPQGLIEKVPQEPIKQAQIEILKTNIQKCHNLMKKYQLDLQNSTVLFYQEGDEHKEDEYKDLVIGNMQGINQELLSLNQELEQLLLLGEREAPAES